MESPRDALPPSDLGASGSSSLDAEALSLLRCLTGDESSEFRAGQLETILRLAAERERVLLVQRTGWGKSAVYFIATRMLRDRGFGPTLLVSPLLALMRNQIEAARRLGVRAETINSSNTADEERVACRGESTARPTGSRIMGNSALNWWTPPTT